MLYLYVGLIIVIEAVAFAALKQYTATHAPVLFAAAVGLYGIICFLLVKSFAFKDIGIVNIFWSIFSVLAIIAVGTIIFHESITWKEAAGVGLALASLVLLGGR